MFDYGTKINNITKITRSHAIAKINARCAQYMSALKLCVSTKSSDDCARISTLQSSVGLPPVPVLPGRPVFQPVCPVSRWNVRRDAICPVFWASVLGLLL